MPPLDRQDRANLPDSAFAHIDRHGRRLLPIHDEAHVRNALARFGRVRFEDDAERERARKRLLVAARRYGIVPVGFITAQLRTERDLAAARRASAAGPLPSGTVTFLFSDIEDSTGLVGRLGERYGPLVADVRSIVRRVAREHDGREVDVRADETFFVFTDAEGALGTAIGMQRATLERQWPDDERVRLRIGLHRGRPSLSDGGYVGLAVNTAARVCAAGHGGQILATASVRDVVRTDVHGARFRPLGEHRLRGIPDGLELFDVEVDGLPTGFPPPREGALSRPR